MKRFLFFIILTCLTTSLFSVKLDWQALSLLPPVETKINNIAVDTQQSMATTTSAVLQRSEKLHTSTQWTQHNFNTPTTTEDLPAGSKVTILHGEPWVVATGDSYNAFYYCNTPKGVGFLNSQSLLFKYYRDDNQLLGIKLLPKFFPSLGKITLEYHFAALLKTGIYILPIHKIEGQQEIKIIVDTIRLEDINGDGKEEFILKGKRYQFDTNKTQGRLTQVETWITQKDKKLIWLYDYETQLLYPNQEKSTFRYLKTQNTKTKELMGIKKFLLNGQNEAIYYTETQFSPLLTVKNEINFPTTAIVQANTLRLREEATVDSKVLGQIKKNQSITLIAMTQALTEIDKKKNYWYKIKMDSGVEGWVYGEFIKISQ